MVFAWNRHVVHPPEFFPLSGCRACKVILRSNCGGSGAGAGGWAVPSRHLEVPSRHLEVPSRQCHSAKQAL